MTGTTLPPGHAPLHKALTKPLLLAGLPETMAVGVWVAVAGGVMIFHQWWLLIIGGLLHVAAATLTQTDPHFFALLRQHLNAQRRLEP
jgi:type IV secretion system protein TrbD